MKNDGGPAFPCEVSFYEGAMQGRQTGNTSGIHTGLTLRDYFAAAAITGLCSAQTQDGEWRHGGPEGTSREAYLIADAMLAARESQG
jgi:hypothetical protein